jgi:hypothetical protein
MPYWSALARRRPGPPRRLYRDVQRSWTSSRTFWIVKPLGACAPLCYVYGFCVRTGLFSKAPYGEIRDGVTS